MLIVDFYMGTFNGDKVIEKVRDFLKATDRIAPYIVGHSSDDRADVKEAFSNAGVDTFEVKPFKYKNLLQIIKNV